MFFLVFFSSFFCVAFSLSYSSFATACGEDGGDVMVWCVQ